MRARERDVAPSLCACAHAAALRAHACVRMRRTVPRTRPALHTRSRRVPSPAGATSRARDSRKDGKSTWRALRRGVPSRRQDPTRACRSFANAPLTNARSLPALLSPAALARPLSLFLSCAGNMKTCSAQRPVSRDDEPLAVDKPGTLIVFTYDVLWQKSEVAWANRWEAYLKTGNDDDIHWFSIMNSLMIVLFMTGMIAMILVRSLYRDIARYNEETSPEEAAEETGWKLVHGDVFRPPSGFFGPMFLSVFVGGGMQVLAMCVCLLVFAVLGFLSPAQQGNLVTAFVLLFVFMGSFAGYFSARLYKMFKGKAWKRNTFLTVRRAAAWRARA
jgi:hypothetical protein